MKKFTKLFLSCAAVAAITASIATAAMAEEVSLTGDVAGTYDPDSGKLTITAPADMEPGTQATLLVYAYGKDRTSVAAADVVGIDQAAAAAFTNSGLKDKPQVPETGNNKYTVALGYYVGSTFTVKEGTLLLGEEDGVLIGDVDLNGEIDLDDATEVVRHSVKLIKLTGDALAAADADQNKEVDLDDATCIVRYSVKLTTDVGYVGEIK